MICSSLFFDRIFFHPFVLLRTDFADFIICPAGSIFNRIS